MAMNYKMGVQVDLEVENFKKQAKEAQDSITQLEKELINLRKEKLSLSDKGELEKNKASIQQTTIALKEQRIALRETNVQLKERVQALKTAGTAQEQFRSQVGASNAVALEFNRIIQDAPFGIIGVGNNIQQLATQFQALKGPGVTTGAALRQSLASIIAPTNLVVLGISALTSLLTAYQLGMFDSADKTKDLKESMQELDEEIRSTVESLNALDTALFNGSVSAEKEKNQVDLLFQTLRDTNQSQQTRINAYNTLVSKYPEIWKGISQETALTSDLTTEYEELIKVIEAKAFAVAVEDELVKIYKDQLSTQKQYNSEIGKELGLQSQLQEIRDKLAKVDPIKGERKASLQFIKNLRDQEEALQRQIEIQQKVSDLTDKLFKSQGAEAESLKAQLQSLNSELAIYAQKLKLKPEEEDKSDSKPFIAGIELTRKSLKNLITDLEGYFQILDNFKRQVKDTRIINPEISLARGSQEQQFQRNLELGGSNAFEKNIELKRKALQNLELSLSQAGLTIDQFFQSIAKGSAEGFVSLDQFILKLGETQSLINESFSVLESGIETTIGDFAFAIGEALANGDNVLQAGGAALLGGLASVLNELGQMAIGAGITIEATKKAFESFGGVGAIAAGVALVALAGAVRAKSRSLGAQLGRGGGGGTAFRASASNSVGSSITGFGSTANPFGDLTLRTSIRGTDIELLLERVNTKSRA